MLRKKYLLFSFILIKITRSMCICLSLKIPILYFLSYTFKLIIKYDYTPIHLRQKEYHISCQTNKVGRYSCFKNIKGWLPVWSWDGLIIPVVMETVCFFSFHILISLTSNIRLINKKCSILVILYISMHKGNNSTNCFLALYVKFESFTRFFI